jgi:hypothetical protein
MTSDHDTIIQARRLLKQQYGELFERVSAVLFEVDPIGINFESNTDEYEPEVGTILPRLKDASTARDVENIIYEEFCRWFDTETVGSRGQYLPIAEKVWEAWREFNKPHA